MKISEYAPGVRTLCLVDMLIMHFFIFRPTTYSTDVCSCSVVEWWPYLAVLLSGCQELALWDVLQLPQLQHINGDKEESLEKRYSPLPYTDPF